MLTEVKKTLKFLLMSTKYNIKSAFEYKTSFFIQMIFMMINNGFFLIFWVIVIGTSGENGIDMKQIYYIWSIPPLAIGLANFFFRGAEELNRYIITGELDTYIIQPQNTMISVASSKCSFGAVGDIVYGIIMGVIASNTIFDFLLILLFSFLGMIIFVCAMTMIELLAVWIGDVQNIAQVYEFSMLITFTTYPEQIFGRLIKFLMFTIVPAGYIVHLPIKIIYDFNAKYLLVVVLATLFFVVSANLMFKLALKKYESGNNIALRG